MGKSASWDVPNAHHRPPQELLIKLGANVRRLRRAKGYTQEQLAELVDLHPRMVQMIEYGKSNILATTAMRLQAALECEWDDLMPRLQNVRSRSFVRRKSR